MNQLVDRLLIQVTSCGFFTGVKYVDGWLIASVCQQNSSSVNQEKDMKKTVSLGDEIELPVAEPKTTEESYWNGDIPWLSVVDFNSDERWVENTEKNITELGLENSSTKLLSTNDIIISARGTGEIAQLKRPMAFNQSCYGIRQI